MSSSYIVIDLKDYKTYGPFRDIKSAETWADDHILEYHHISVLENPDTVIPWEDTDPTYECKSCGNMLYVEGSCRCLG